MPYDLEIAPGAKGRQVEAQTMARINAWLEAGSPEYMDTRPMATPEQIAAINEAWDKSTRLFNEPQRDILAFIAAERHYHHLLDAVRLP